MVGFWTTTTATGPQWVDNYNDADLSEYAHGTKTAFSFTTSTVAEGSHALRYDAGAAWNHIISDVGGGLPNYPAPGDTFQYKTRFLTGGESMVVFGIQTTAGEWTPQGYGVRVAAGDIDSFDFEVSTGSGFSDIQTTPAAVNSNTWYTVEVVWGTNNTFDLTLINPDGTTAASMTGVSDTTHTSQGGIAFEANTHDATGGNVFWDDFRIV